MVDWPSKKAGPSLGRPWENPGDPSYFLTFKSAQAFVNWSLVHVFAYSALYPLLHCSEVGVLAAMAEVETASAKTVANKTRMFTLPGVSRCDGQQGSLNCIWQFRNCQFAACSRTSSERYLMRLGDGDLCLRIMRENYTQD